MKLRAKPVANTHARRRILGFTAVCRLTPGFVRPYSASLSLGSALHHRLPPDVPPLGDAPCHLGVRFPPSGSSEDSAFTSFRASLPVSRPCWAQQGFPRFARRLRRPGHGLRSVVRASMGDGRTGPPAGARAPGLTPQNRTRKNGAGEWRKVLLFIYLAPEQPSSYPQILRRRR